MSSAPLPSLRSLWENGGAPGAFVRRDQSLTHQLEQLLHAADGAQTMGDVDAFSTLVRGFSWDEALPDNAPLDAMEGVHEAPVRRVRDAAPSASPVRDAGSHRRPAHTDVAALRRGESAHADTSRMSANANASTADLHAHASSHAWPAHTAARDTHESDTAELVAARAEGNVTAHALPATAAELRRVAPIGPRHDAAEHPRIAALLDASEPPAARAMSTSPHANRASAQVAHPATMNQSHTPASQLADAVRRVELVRAANRRDTQSALPSRSGAPVRGTHVTRSDGVESQPTRPAVPAFSNELSSASAPAVGMRGLVERANRNRAEFFFGDTQFEAAPHADTDFDAFSSLLDDAARRDGVDLEEALS
jgi:hypothetical protein